LQELVLLSAKAISDRIVSRSCTLVWVAKFDDAAPPLFAKSYSGRHSLCPERLSHGADEILGLPIQTREVKPVDTMKTLSRPFVFAVLAIIAIGAAVSFRAFAAGSQKQTVGPKKFNLKIGRTATEYVDVKSKDAFVEALKHFGEDQYDINFLDHPAAPVEHYPPLPHSAKTGIKTDKVTTSEIAKRGPAGESVANDPNVVSHLSADSATDIKSVLDTFQ